MYKVYAKLLGVTLLFSLCGTGAVSPCGDVSVVILEALSQPGGEYVRSLDGVYELKCRLVTVNHDEVRIIVTCEGLAGNDSAIPACCVSTSDAAGHAPTTAHSQWVPLGMRCRAGPIA